jgi:hypothetical protein
MKNRKFMMVICVLALSVIMMGSSCGGNDNVNNSNTNGGGNGGGGGGGGLTIPVAPNGLTAVAVSDTQINLTWVDNSNNETGFRVERRVVPPSELAPGSETNNFTQIAEVGAGVTSYADTGCAAATSYEYRVLAYNNAGCSTYSGVVGTNTGGGGGGAIDASGVWSGAWDGVAVGIGAVDGTWTATVTQTNNQVSGTIDLSSIYLVPDCTHGSIIGSVVANTISFGTIFDTGCENSNWQGTVSDNGINISGNWSASDSSGTFTGSKQ